jgi:carbon storage regulator CsrA
MLVLSRKKDQRILFPSLGITLEVLRVSGSTVSVGIQAPQSIQVLRGELQPTRPYVPNEPPNQSDAVSSNTKQLSHEFRNQLNKIFLSIALVQKQLSCGLNAEAETTLQQAFEALTHLDRGIEIDPAHTSVENAGADNSNANHGVSSKRTLLVEDDANERALLAGYLRISGYQVFTANDGVEALELLAKEPVDLIVLDMRMPRMNGLETLQAIRKDPFLKDIQVVVVSGEESQSSCGKSETRGVSEWFEKPLDPAKLIEHLESSRN